MERFQSRVALVTGAASGIGRATALAFAREGAHVIAADVQEEAGHALANEIGALFVRCDVTKTADIDAMITAAVARFGRIDCAVNNAGVEGFRSDIANYPDEEWQKVIAIDLVSVFSCMKRELVVMLPQGSGAIVNLSSIYGTIGAPSASAYAAAKHGVIGLTQSAALEYGARGIRINAVAPGYIETPMVTERLLDHGRNVGAHTRLLGSQPSGRLGKPDEVAGAILWLCSDAASYVSGHSLTIDGGYTVR